jgi:Flp pilus assembly pilin Flp
VLPIFVRIHLTIAARLRGEGGQTSAEYALVLLGAASVALLVALWARDTDKLGKLLDTIFDSIVKLVK